jgi:hypothetical protein
MTAMGQRREPARLAHTVRSRKAPATTPLARDQLEQLIETSHRPATDRAATVVAQPADDDIEMSVSIDLPLRPGPEIPPPAHFPDASGVDELFDDEVIELTPKPARSSGRWLVIAFALVAAAWIAARLAGA